MQPASQFAAGDIADLTEKDERHVPLFWTRPPQPRCHCPQLPGHAPQLIDDLLRRSQRHEHPHHAIVPLHRAPAPDMEPYRGFPGVERPDMETYRGQPAGWCVAGWCVWYSVGSNVRVALRKRQVNVGHRVVLWP